MMQSIPIEIASRPRSAYTFGSQSLKARKKRDILAPNKTERNLERPAFLTY
jgi:hypothetical protein